MTATPTNLLLLRQFREFYAEAARLRAEAEHAAPITQAAAAADAGGEGAGKTVDPVASAWRLLHGLLQAQAEEASRRGGALGARVYQEVQYMLAALADELFLQGDWEGRARWPLLETSLFRTQSAGETVFERIDALLEHPESGYADLAAVYFWALALGFEGKFRGAGEASLLQQYRRRLFQLLYRDRPRLFDGERALFPQSYLHNLEEGAGRSLPSQRLWLGVLALVVLAWLGLAQLGWNHVTRTLDQAVCQINGGADCGPQLP